MARHRSSDSAYRSTPSAVDDRPARAVRCRPGIATLVAGLCSILVIGLSIPSSSQAGATRGGLFGSQEIHSTNLAQFPKWRGTLERFDQELASCVPGDCGLRRWRDMLLPLNGQDARTQLRLINRAVNRFRYVEDFANWRRADYWATPLQFLARSGDCEDFAIAKYMALRELGIPSQDMRIVILRDHSRQVMHAVLAVYVDGRPYVLDNLRDAVVAAEDIDTYEPIYSINEQGWWLHRI